MKCLFSFSFFKQQHYVPTDCYYLASFGELLSHDMRYVNTNVFRMCAVASYMKRVHEMNPAGENIEIGLK